MRCCRLLIVVAALAMAACSPRKSYVIGVSQCSEDIWRDKLVDELRMGTYLYGDVELRIASADDDDRRQMEQIDSLVAGGIDLLIVSPNKMNTVTEAIDRAYDSGIPVVLFDRKTDSEKYTAFIGADNYAIGRIMASFIASSLHERGRVVEITGLAASSPAEERHRGFADELSRHPGITLAATIHGDWTQASGAAAMDSAINSGTVFDCVFAHNDRMADGARQQAAVRGLTDKPLYFGIDALPDADGGMRRVKDGLLAASYIYPTRGDLVIHLAMNILEGKPYSRENHLESAIVTADNVEAMLMQADEIRQQGDRLRVLHARVDRYLAQYSHQKVFLLLSAIIIALLICLFVYAYRTAIMKRRMAEESANAKLQFFTNVSHEFRTPLTLIADPVDRMLADPATGSEQRGLLLLVRKNVSLMLRLVDQILDLRKVQNGKMTVTASRFDLAASLREWTANFGPQVGKKGIELCTDVPDELTVCTDRNKVERIFYNLMSNALKYTPEGGRVTASLTAGAGGGFTLSVADNGIGIPADDQPHVFERFFQARGNAGGTGIGLAIVKAFADILGGTAAVQSGEGRGTTFTVTLPQAEPTGTAPAAATPTDIAAEYVADEAAPAPAATPEADRVTGPDAPQSRDELLVIDDNEDIRRYVGSLFAAEYDVKFAADGREGLDKAMAEVPSLIICDVMMPGMDGFAVCRSLKSATATNHIPVILLTADALDGRRADGYDCGADAYITKPFSGRVLRARVRNLLENRRMLKEIYRNGAPDELRSENTDELFLADFRAKVQARLADPDLSVEALSAELGLSRVQMYRKVKALTGCTPVELIRITRLKRAERLLKAGGHTVAEVSYEVGFSSPSYFTKCYKDYFGHTPGGK